MRTTRSGRLECAHRFAESRVSSVVTAASGEPDRSRIALLVESGPGPDFPGLQSQTLRPGPSLGDLVDKNTLASQGAPQRTSASTSPGHTQKTTALPRARKEESEDLFGLHMEAGVAPDHRNHQENRKNGVYYNELAPFPLAWLRELGAAGAIPNGTFDERSIEDVVAADLLRHRQCHFFAGIGVWPFALEQAGWPTDALTVWSASLPCQPFSSAGKRRGFDDPRHLWPVFLRLVQQCRPSVIVGEQTASPDGLAWFDLVSAQLEGEGYAVGAVDLCAAGFGSPQKRQRIYWCAARLADAAHIKRALQRKGRRESRRWEEPVGDGSARGAARPTSGFWGDVEWVDCADGSRRPIKPGLRAVADRSPAGVEQLRAFGNALNAETAIGFAAALRETLAGADLGYARN